MLIWLHFMDTRCQKASRLFHHLGLSVTQYQVQILTYQVSPISTRITEWGCQRRLNRRLLNIRQIMSSLCCNSSFLHNLTILRNRWQKWANVVPGQGAKCYRTWSGPPNGRTKQNLEMLETRRFNSNQRVQRRLLSRGLNCALVSAFLLQVSDFVLTTRFLCNILY